MAGNFRKVMTTINDIKILDIPKIHDAKGNLSVIEGKTIPFEIQLVHYLYDVPSHAEREGNAHIQQQKVMVALSGSFEVVLKDGTDQKIVLLNKPNVGLYIPNGIWREIRNFSSGSVCLVVASQKFAEADYIRDFTTFKLSKDRIS